MTSRGTTPSAVRRMESARRFSARTWSARFFRRAVLPAVSAGSPVPPRVPASASLISSLTRAAATSPCPPSSLFTSSLLSPSAAELAQRTQSSLLWIAFNIPDLKLPLQAATRDPRL